MATVPTRMATITLDKTTLSGNRAHKADTEMYHAAFYPGMRDGSSGEGGDGFAPGGDGFALGGSSPLAGDLRQPY